MKLKLCNRIVTSVKKAFDRDPAAPAFLNSDLMGRYSYRAFDKQEGVEVAWSQSRINDSVMVCSQKMDQLNTEIQLLRTFRHKNIVKLFASWIDEDKGIVNIITEYFTSGSLRQYAPFLSFILL
jgi:serine/threonine protein kinase